MNKAQEAYYKATGYYIVQELHIVDVREATGENLTYTHEQMKDLCEHLQEKTYEGDVWCDEINNFNDELLNI